MIEAIEALGQSIRVVPVSLSHAGLKVWKV
jgi:hypothetical protein